VPFQSISAGDEVAVDRCQREVTIDFPEELRLRHAPYVASVAALAGTDQGDGIVVESVMEALPLN
jgi:hypothetical protein